ncbi:MAG: sulfatase-like hydrolase/transferase [Planctomycetota bacterium]
MLTAISRFLFIATLVLFGHSNALLSNQPNIIVIFTDDQGYSDLGIQGIHEDVQTPHIDDLVESGIRMTCGFVTAPQCMPSRVGILTGRYQQFSGVESNVLWTEQNSTNAMLPKTSTIASKLKEQGYVTGMAGKWGVGGTFSRRLPKQSLMITNQMLDRLPHARGFDEYFCGTLDPYVASHNVKGEPLLNPPEIQRDPRYRVNVQADAAVSFIDRHAHGEQPFFLYFAPYSPHSPFDAPKDYLDRFSHIKNERRRTCLAMMSCVDDSVGRLIGKLKEHGTGSDSSCYHLGLESVRYMWRVYSSSIPPPRLFRS